jgi:two-component system cell cycle response regulator DivK
MRNGEPAGNTSNIAFSSGIGQVETYGSSRDGASGCFKSLPQYATVQNRYTLPQERASHEMTKILLVEDNEFNRDMLSRRLQRRGFEVSIAEDGELGIATAHANRPDLILMDMDLPVVDGWEATRRLKADSTMRSIPIIALTAHALQSDCDRAYQAGCDDFATKPIEFALLIEKINRALQARGGAAGS